MEIPLLHDIVIIFGLSIIVLLFCHKIKIPSIVGFLVTGVLCGPFGLGLVKGESDVQTLATTGIILLLFIVGMEFSLKKILEYKRYFLIGGFLQVGLTVGAGYLIGLLDGRPIGESIFLGFLLSLSSTAIVLRVLEEKLESDSPHGRVILGMMIFQDMVAIPMMLILPLLGGQEIDLNMNLAYDIGKGLLVLTAVLFSALKLVPYLLYQIAKTRSRELFLLSVLTICSAVAWATSSIGLSLSLGAFLAGLIISDSDYRAEAIGDILPFQDIFTSFFFVSIGMLLNVGFLFEQPLLILSVTISVMLLKACLAGISTYALGMPLRTVAITGIAMCQVGEFSFVLAKSGFEHGLGSDYHYQLFLAVALLSMAFTPSLLHYSTSIASLILRLPFPNKVKMGLHPPEPLQHHLHRDHIIIVGFGLSGRHLAHSAKVSEIPYLILEMNAETVKREKRRGEPIHFGDASHDSILLHANILEAKVIAVVINDPIAAGNIVATARKLNPGIYIIVRTRYLKEMKIMHDLGADEVIPDEFGSSIEVFTRVLQKYFVPSAQVQKIISEMRIEGYEMLRLLYREPTTLADLQITLSDVLVETFRVQASSRIAGKTMQEIELRKAYGVTAMLIRRGKDTIANIDAQTRILIHDVVVLVGTHDQLKKASLLFET